MTDPIHRTLISPVALASHLDDPAWRIVDVRHELTQPERWGRDAYAAGHIPGAEFVHLDLDLSAPKTGRNGRHPLPSREAAAALFGRLGIDATKQVVEYDQNTGMYASRLWWMLRWLGHEAVAVLDGGFARWRAEGLPVETGERPSVSATFEPRAPLEGTVDADALMADLASHRHLVIDARAPERYRGDTEPFDARAGHIPGALNRPYGRNVGPNGTFLAPHVLRAELEGVLAGRPASDVVHQCGSGVSACHNVLAFEHAGLSGSRLYPGSWSEWSADPARPVATGDE